MPQTNVRFTATGLASGENRVDRENRVIRGVAVASIGEAKGHGQRVDAKTLDQIFTLGQQAGEKGLKSRFTHPNACGDSLGKHIGRTKNYRRDGDTVRGDLHLADAAFKSPEGDLGTYLLDLADEDPDAFGMSIVFDGDTEDELDEAGKPKVDTTTGKKLLPATRITKLKAVDATGDPAANDGLFSDGNSRQPIAQVADALDRLPASQPAELLSRAATFLSSYSALRFGQPITQQAFSEAFSLAVPPSGGESNKPPEGGTTNKDSAMSQDSEKKFTQADLDAAIAKAVPAAVEKAFTQKKDRDDKILSFCVSRYCGDSTKARERAEQFSADPNVTPEAVQQVLFGEMATAMKNPGGDASADPLNQGGASADKAADAKFGAEYDEHAKLHEALGMSKDDFIATRKEEEAAKK